MPKSSLNHVFRLVWNNTLGAFVPASENTKAKGKRTVRSRKSLATIGLALVAGSVSAAPILIDGAGNSGEFVGSHFGGQNSVVLGDADSQTIFTGFFTEGGAGSGGGAGLGGALFVDEGAALTVRNGVFIGNKVKGGEGGALPSIRLGDSFINNSPESLDLLGYEQQLIRPTLSFNSSTNQYEFDTIAIDSGTTLLTDGTNISFGELGNTSAIITDSTSNSVTLDQAISISASDIESLALAQRDLSNDPIVSGYEINGDTIDFLEANPGELDDVFSKLTIKGQIFIDGQNATIESINYNLNGDIESITLDSDLSGVATTGNLDVIAVTKFDTQQFALSGSDVVITGDLRGFKEGMSLFDGDGNNLSATITSVSADGSTFTVDNAAGLSGVTSLTAKKSPILSANQIVLSKPNSEIAAGVAVYVPDTNFTAIVQNYDANTGVVTFDQNLDQSIIDNVNEGGNPLTVAVRNVLGVNGDTLTIRKVSGQEFESGMTINGNNIAADSSIESVVDNGSSYTITLSSGAVEDSNITSIVARSPLAKGGSLNGLSATGNTGSNGNNGFDANYYSSFFAEGEGGEGTRGYAGDEGSTGAGFDGGNGGNGSDGLGVNLQLITELYSATTDFIESTGELIGVLTPNGAPIPLPDFADIPFAVVDLAAKSIVLGTATANTVLWAQNLERGLAGMGGEGGEGGEAGAGAEFFGGGSGGDGGNGGEGARSHTDGGNGGDGGRGGDGGFGAGGGNGGAGGDEGSTGAADGGDGGDGGFGGFAAGDGSNGNGLFGGGGSGFGGALFVRDGGTLLIEGESLFENNTASGGSSNNRGAAGDGAGNAIFMMKGSNVTLSPGLGNTIRFEDDIADDSAGTYEGAPLAEGNGADITIGGAGGLVIFNAENTYTGDTILEGATLDAEFGVGIHDSSRLRFNGQGSVGETGINALSLNTVGTLLQSDDVTSKRQGSLSHEITWTGSGGFASGVEEGIRVNLGETIAGIGQTLSWGNNGFFEGAAVDSTLTFGSEQSVGSVTFENDVTLNNNSSRVAVYNTTSEESSSVTLSGDWTGGNLSAGSDVYSGTVYLTGDNQLDNFTVFGGLATTEGGGSLSRVGNQANVLIEGGTLDLLQDEELGTTTVNSGGILNAIGFVSATDILNNGTINVTGGMDADNIVNNSGNTFNALSDVNVTGTIDNTVTGQWNQKADVSAQDVINNGNWRIFGLETEDGTRSLTTNTLTGSGTFTLDTTDLLNETTSTGSLDIVQLGDSTFDGIIEGEGSVEKAGAGHLSISNTQTFSGGLDVTGGTFETLEETVAPDPVTSGGLLSDTGAVHIFENATFIAGNDDTVGSVEVDADGAFVLNADITTAANFTNNGTTSLTELHTITTGGGLTGAGAITVGEDAALGLLQIGDTNYSGSISGEGVFVKGGAGTLTLNGQAGSIDLAGDADISGDQNNSFLFEAGVGIFDGKVVLASENILAADQDVWILGGELEVTQAQNFNELRVDDNSAVNATAEMAITDIINDGQITASGGVLADSIDNNAGATFNAFSDIAVTDAFTNALNAQLNQQGDLTATDVINNGNWRVFSEDNGDAATRILATETLTGNGTFSLNTGSLDVNLSDDSTFDGIIEGSGSFEKSGLGHFSISNTHTFTGGLNVTGGTFETLTATVGPDTTGGLLADTGAIHVFENATFIAGNSDTVGSVEVDEDGDFVLNANMTTVGDFTNNGTTGLTDDQTLTTGGGLAGLGSLTIAADSELTLVQSGNTTYSGDMTGAGSFTKDGTGTLTLNGVADSVNLDDGLTINGGKLSLDGAFILNGNQDVLVSDNGELELVSGNQKIDQLSGEGVIDLNVNTLQVNNGGDFEGLVVGNGILDILNGSFNVNNSITSASGLFNVNSGATATVGASSSLNFADITVQDSGTLEVVGQATVKNLVVATNSTLHLGDLNTAGSVDSSLASVYGTLSGNGEVSNTVNVYGGGLLDPGNSPGILTFTDLNMLSGSVANMEIISSGVAGTDFDQIQVSGDLTINDGTRLDIIKFGAAAELTMGETINIFNFAPGNVSGQFGSATSTYTNDVIYNLATGDVVGLGGTSASDFKSEVANTQNQKAMLASLEVEMAGGVSQFYGGNLVPAIAEAYGDANAVNTVFEKSSPEVYASLNDQARLSLVNDLEDIFIDDKAVRGLSLNVRQGTNSSDNGGGWANYDLDYNKTQFMYTLPFSEGAIRAAFSDDSREVDSRYLSADTEGYSFSLSVSHSLPLEGLSLLANISSISQSSDVYRQTLTGSSSAKDIDANGRMLGLGVIYQQKMDDLLLTGTLGAMHFNTKVSAFDELNTTTLEALSVDEQRTSGNGILAKVGVASQLNDKWMLGSELSYLHMHGASDYDVTANVAVEETNFTVSNPGAGESLLGLNLSAKYQIENNWLASFDAKITGENGLSGDYQAKLGINYSF